MAKYTTQLKSIVESGYDLGLKDYPIWNEDFRPTLNNMLLKHYWFREIGFETAGLFKFHLNRAMNEIMMYYNLIYTTTQYDFDPLHNYTLQEVFGEQTTDKNNKTETRNLTDTGSSTAEYHDENTTNTESVYSDTPQGALESGAIARGEYATNATIGSGNGTSTTNGTTSTNNTNTGTVENNEAGEGSRNYTKTITGNQYHNMGELIKDYRDSMINITMEIITHPAISELFMRVY